MGVESKTYLYFLASAASGIDKRAIMLVVAGLLGIANLSFRN
jgi:hypothetical protein